MAAGTAGPKKGKGTKSAPKLGRDEYGRSVPGFLGRGNAPTAEARSYASWNRKTGPDGSSTPISLPNAGMDSN